jgi:hypothetical protein
LISVISFYGKNEGWGSIPCLEAGCRITRYLFLLVYFSGVAQLVEQLAVNQEALIRFPKQRGEPVSERLPERVSAHWSAVKKAL